MAIEAQIRLLHFCRAPLTMTRRCFTRSHATPTQARTPANTQIYFEQLDCGLLYRKMSFRGCRISCTQSGRGKKRCIIFINQVLPGELRATDNRYGKRDSKRTAEPSYGKSVKLAERHVHPWTWPSCCFNRICHRKRLVFRTLFENLSSTEAVLPKTD